MEARRARNRQSGDLPSALLDPQVRLIGDVDYELARSLVRQLGDVSEDLEDVAVELTTPGGDADLARRMVHEIDSWRASRRSRLLFLGLSQVHSAGVTFMSAFPPENRFLTRDAILLIHGRIGFDEIVHHSRFNWYLRAQQAFERGLVAGLL